MLAEMKKIFTADHRTATYISKGNGKAEIRDFSLPLMNSNVVRETSLKRRKTSGLKLHSLAAIGDAATTVLAADGVQPTTF